jgi:hypothetical protein
MLPLSGSSAPHKHDTWIPLRAATDRIVPTSATLASSTAIRLRHLANHLHRLGPRPVFEILAEALQGAPLIERLERYAQLDPDLVHALGADVLPPVIVCIKSPGTAP